MKILITGANGQLAHDFKKVLSARKTIICSKKELDITSLSSIKVKINQYKPDLILNTASYNKVEEGEVNIRPPFLVNFFGVYNLVKLCLKYNIILVHFSTDYVFDGKKRTPYKEEDRPQPVNIYGLSKLCGEHTVRYNLKNYYLIRTSGLYGIKGSNQKKGNFVEIMLKKAGCKEEIKVVGDVKSSPTYTYDLAEGVKRLITTKEFGVYHITNSGFCSWYEFAKEIFRISKIKANLQKISYKDLKAKVLRPKYSVLDNSKLEKVGLPKLRHWSLALEDYLKERRKNL